MQAGVVGEPGGLADRAERAVLAGALGVSGPVPRSRSRNEDVAISAAASVVTAFANRANSARICAGPIRDS